MTAIDPGALVVMKLASELCQSQAQVKHQQRVIAAMAAALRTERQASTALAVVLDILLSEAGDE
jgi:hypothetical protein